MLCTLARDWPYKLIIAGCASGAHMRMIPWHRSRDLAHNHTCARTHTYKHKYTRTHTNKQTNTTETETERVDRKTLGQVVAGVRKC